MQINSIPNYKTQPSFRMIKTDLISKPGDVIHDAVRYAFLPEKNEIVSKNITRFYGGKNDISIKELPDGELDFYISSFSDDNFHSASPTLHTHSGEDTVKSLGERIKSLIDENFLGKHIPRVF